MVPTNWIARLALASLVMSPALTLAHFRGEPVAESVYTLSNDARGNHVLKFAQAADGTLQLAARFPTGGTGAGAGLGNQGALATDGEYVFAVNPGSNDLSVLRIERKGLRLVDRISSGGVQPISVTVNGNLVYVLNAGSDSIAGFTQSRSGKLQALAGSEHGLSGQRVGPAQIQFSQNGRTLIVTEKNTNKIVTFSLTHWGVPYDRTITASPGQTPFGFALARRNLLIVSEAAGGSPNASSVSSLRVRHDGSLDVLEASEPTTQTAACWVATSPDGRFAYVTNTGSGTVSSFRVLANGRLLSLDAAGTATSTGAGSSPIDDTFSADGQYLNVLSSGANTITTFAIERGHLSKVGEISGLPPFATGLIAF